MVGSVGSHDEWGFGAGDVLFRNEDSYLARVGSGMAGGDDELGGIVGIGCAEGSFVAGDSGIVLALRRLHCEVGFSRYSEVRSGRVGRRLVGWTDDEVAVGVGGWQCAVGEFLCLHVSRRAGIACRVNCMRELRWRGSRSGSLRNSSGKERKRGGDGDSEYTREELHFESTLGAR